jgi:putative selenate reductase
VLPGDAESLVSRSETDQWYRKPIKHRELLPKKINCPTDCFTAPCSDGCPIHQDVQEYLSLAERKSTAKRWK